MSKLIKVVTAKLVPRRLYLVWANLKARPDLEAEVDLRHAAAILEKGRAATSRVVVWNAVASEWFNTSSEEEKLLTRREAFQMLKIERKTWEEQVAADLSSPGAHDSK